MPQMNMQAMMKQAQKMQRKLAEVQDHLDEVEASSSAGGGMVKVVATGDMKVKEIVIDPEAVDPEDVELLQDMVLAAVNDALASAQEAANQKVAAVTGGLNIPGLM